MENTHSDFTEGMAHHIHDLHLLTSGSFPGQAPKPKGDNDDDEEDDDEDNARASADSDDNPSIDEGVVHSPLPTDNGGKPKS